MTTSKSEIVAPVVAENGIEFYVSNDGERSGVSIRGLSRLCGVAESTIRNAVNRVRDRLPSKVLESFTGELFHCGMTSNQQAKVITSEAASEIVLYYAFDSSVANATAQFSAREFAKMGMHTWIKEVSGFAKNDDNQGLTDAINALLIQSQRTEKVVSDLTTEVKSWRIVKKYADMKMNGFNVLVEEMSKAESAAEEEAFILVEGEPNTPRTYSVAEWLLEVKGATLTSARMKSFGRRVAETYKSLKQQPIKKGYRIVGEYNALIAVYAKEDFPILHLAYTNYVSELS